VRLAVTRLSLSAAHVSAFRVSSSGYPLLSFFLFNDTATTEIYTLSLHDALPISGNSEQALQAGHRVSVSLMLPGAASWFRRASRSEEHTSELQSRENLVCRLLLEKKKNK